MSILLKSKLAAKPKLALLSAAALLSGVAAIAFAVNLLRANPEPDEQPLIDELVALPQHGLQRVIHAQAPEKGLLLLIADAQQPHSPQADALTAYAKQLAELSYYVAIVDNSALLTTTALTTTALTTATTAANSQAPCLDVAQQLSALGTELSAHFMPSHAGLPILVGVGNGAATSYAALAQADKKTFHAAVNINFTPALQAHKPLCEQEQFIASDNELIPVKRLASSFYLFQTDHLPSTAAARAFADGISNAKFTLASGGDETPEAESLQILQWLDPRLADQISADASDSDLPLIEVTRADNSAPAGDTMAILLTGDGGWAEIDKQLAERLSAQGIPTLGFDSLSYFWKARNPVNTSQELEQALLLYLEKWHKQRVILIGYSFGADVLPFIANNLSDSTRQKISLIALLGMGKTAAFEFRLSSWMDADKSPDRRPILPEIEKLHWAKSICIYGVEDDDANCLPTAQYGVKAISMSGDHHFDENYDALVQHIIAEQKPAP